ncbi:molybdopterin-guanine dinucleotide biosynthesis protein B, partial [Chloroflexota bacterium]
GKTTVLELVIRELSEREYRVGTVKHDTHGFDMDRPGKDTWRHAQAGSRSVVISGPRRMALIRRVEDEIPLDELVLWMGDLDIVLTEGYKRGSSPKIEVARQARGTELLCGANEVIAIMSDFPVDMPVPHYDLSDAVGVVDLLEERYLTRTREEGA